jgi:TonB family protein
MKDRNNIKTLFTAQGCLSAEGILLYRSGKLSEDEMLLAQKHIAECELCKEAVEGAGNFSTPDQYSKGIDMLKEKWGARHVRERTLPRATWAAIITVAASVVLGVFIYLANRYQKSVRMQQIASIYKQGVTLNNALNTSDDFLPPVNEEIWSEADRNESVIRKINQKNLMAANEKSIPVAILHEARITAVSHEKESKDQPATITERKQGTLRYPYRIMSMPPPEYSERQSEQSRKELFYMVEEMPQFLWKKNKAFNRFLQQNIQYPAKALEKHIEGRVYVQFTIDEKGKLIDGTILKSCHPLLDNEVLRVIKTSPVWKPGKQNGKAVKVSMVMPVDFVVR